jgi:hypothetical protein
VQAFVTKLDDETLAAPSSPHKVVHQYKPVDNNARAPVNNRAARLSSSASIPDHVSDHGADADSEASSDSDFLEFDVYEREGVDKIMQSVASGFYNQSNTAREVCDYLEVFEKLAPGREQVGYLVCDQLTTERSSNLHFQTSAIGVVELNELHVIVSDMHAELLALSDRMDRDRSLIRTYQHPQEPNEWLEISAALMRRHPAKTLFVSRRRRRTQVT